MPNILKYALSNFITRYEPIDHQKYSRYITNTKHLLGYLLDMAELRKMTLA